MFLMRLVISVIFTVIGALAADEQQLALALKAQSDFDRVELSATPQLATANACVQSEAALLPVVPALERSLTYFRKGYCTLAASSVTGKPADFLAAATAFEASISNWAPRAATPVPSGLRAMAAIARLKAGPDEAAIRQLQEAADARNCPAAVMSVSLCGRVLQLANLWLGYLAFERGDLNTAGSRFAAGQDSPWRSWTAGRKEYLSGNYRAAAADFRAATDSWSAELKDGDRGLETRLTPQPDMPRMLTELGGAQLLAGDPKAAIHTLDAATKADPEYARPLFLRARAREVAGEKEQAQADYNLASRTAFAAAQDLASGEAHLYRGILLYRRGDYSHAEDEFSSALNLAIPEEFRPDAAAWRHMAAVAGGSCGESSELLNRSLRDASRYFPASEAQALIASCRNAGAGPPFTTLR
jgi:tetratricopeptide (TPR) repeat protein